MSRPVYIYALQDPRTGEYRYVGVSVNLKRRMRAHLRLRERNPHKNNWLRSLLAQNQRPHLIVLEVTGIDRCKGAEKWWIYHLRKREQQRLLNLTDGGDGFVGLVRTKEQYRKIAEKNRGRKHTAESLRKMSESQRGKKKPHSKEHGLKLSLALKGRRLSPEQIEKTRMANKGRKRSEEFKRRVSAGLRGRKCSEETRMKISEAHRKRVTQGLVRKGWEHTEEARQRISRTLMGHHVSEESRRKMSESGKKRKPPSEADRERRREISAMRRRDGRGHYIKESKHE